MFFRFVSRVKDFVLSDTIEAAVVNTGVLFGVSEITAQYCHFRSSDSVESFNPSWYRVGATAAYGAALIGPFNFVYYPFLHRTTMQFAEKNILQTAMQTSVSLLTVDPIELGVFLAYVGLVNGKSFEQVQETFKRDYWPTLGTKAVASSVFHTVNYGLVPLRRRGIGVGLFEILETTGVSWVEKQEKSPFEKMKEYLEKQEEQFEKVKKFFGIK